MQQYLFKKHSCYFIGYKDLTDIIQNIIDDTTFVLNLHHEGGRKTYLDGDTSNKDYSQEEILERVGDKFGFVVENILLEKDGLYFIMDENYNIY